MALTTSDNSTTTVIDALNRIVLDLSRHLSAEQRYIRLLQVWRELFPCDACALLQLQDGCLTPRAADGLDHSIMGRRFDVADHPRLSRILQQQMNQGITRFDAHSDLPDPYDGLIDTPDGELHIHDCMGTVLTIDDKPWGIVTMDALNPKAFDAIDQASLTALISLTSAAIKTAELIDALEHQAQHQQQVAAALVEEQLQQEMLGNSQAMQTLNADIDLVAQSDLTALVFGETGVGKELVARAIHQRSLRRDFPIVTVNCAALPEALVESELFGHMSGAFSGANKDRLGKFELADNGTLFLDEVGELPLAIQSKLLRVLQSGELQRLGSDDQHKVDVRIITATNRDLKAEVSAGRFRADLYHRLSVYPLHVPALRERGNDLLLLSGYFLTGLQRKLGVNSLGLTAEAQTCLLSYGWPGNVRELEHLLSRAALKAIGRMGRTARAITLAIQDLDIDHNENTVSQYIVDPSSQESIDDNAGDNMLSLIDLKTATDHFQRQHIQQQLQLQKGNKAATARALGLDRSNFLRLIKRLGLQDI